MYSNFLQYAYKYLSIYDVVGPETETINRSKAVLIKFLSFCSDLTNIMSWTHRQLIEYSNLSINIHINRHSIQTSSNFFQDLL